MMLVRMSIDLTSLENSMKNTQNIKIKPEHYVSIQFLGIYLNKTEILTPKYIFTYMFIAVLFSIIMIW